MFHIISNGDLKGKKVRIQVGGSRQYNNDVDSRLNEEEQNEPAP